LEAAVNTDIYGRDFAPLWDTEWSFWGEEIWPFLKRTVATQAPDARDWLDLCCGAGSLLTFVCQSGYSAVGVDISSHQLERAKQNAPDAALVCADICDFSLDRKFDVVTCLFDSLNYLTAKADLARAFKNVKRHLKPGGLFVFDMLMPAGFRKVWDDVQTIDEDERLVVIESSYNENRALGHCRITGFVKEGQTYRRFDEEHFERGYAFDEIEKRLTTAGFGFKAYDAYSKSRPSKSSERLLFVCHPHSESR
jgi:SAM-dependent methyltransferase